MGQPKLKFKPIDRSATRLVLPCLDFDIHLQVRGRLNKRQRRAIILAAARQLSEKFKRIGHGCIFHDDSSYLDQIHETSRWISLNQAPRLGTPIARRGLLIRLRRLELKMTQDQLAKRSGMERRQIGRIERGLHMPRPENFQKLEDALQLTIPLLPDPEDIVPL